MKTSLVRAAVVSRLIFACCLILSLLARPAAGQQVNNPLNEALDTDVSFNTSGLHAWQSQTNFSHDGADAAMLTLPAHELNTSKLNAYVTGPARVSFWWYWDSLSSNSFTFYLTVDDPNQFKNQHFPGYPVVMREWTNVVLDVPFGPHLFTWWAENYTWSPSPVTMLVDEFSVTPLIGDAPQVSITASDNPVEIGTPLFLHANATGPGTLAYSWFFQASGVSNAVRVAGGDTADLSFVKIRSRDLGTYTCVVSNFFGTNQASIVVTGKHDLVADALDEPTWLWDTSGYADWFATAFTSRDGSTCLQSPPTYFYDQYHPATVGTRITGPVLLKYYIKYTPENRYYYDTPQCSVNIDGRRTKTYMQSDGPFDWRQDEIVVPYGDHLVDWQWGLDYLPNGKVWLDTATIEPIEGVPPTITGARSDVTVEQGQPVTLSVTVTGTAPMFYQWYKGDDSLDVSQYTLLDGETNSTLQLKGKLADTGLYYATVNNYFGAADARFLTRVKVTPSRISLSAALDSPDFIWKSDPDNPWFGETHMTHDHRSAAQGDSFLQTTVVGPGVLTFWWKSSGLLQVQDDSPTPITMLPVYRGSGDWEQATMSVPSGPHPLTWLCDGTSYLDSVHFTPKKLEPPKIVQQPKPQHADVDGTGIATFSVKAIVNPPASYQWTFNGTDIDSATNTSLVVSNITWDAVGFYNVRISDPIGSVQSDYALLSAKTEYGTAVGEPGYAWGFDSELDPKWFVQSRVKHGKSPALQSMPTADNDSSTIYNSIQGPGTVSFWWRVSSETNFDSLQFFIEGQLMASISGESGWQHASFHLVAMQQNVRWVYVKDFSSTHGMDCGWISDVTFTPDPLDLVHIVPHEQTVYEGSVAHFDTVTRGIPPAGYSWTGYSGYEIGNAPSLKIIPVTRDDDGTYTVVVNGDSGAAGDSAILHVKPAVEDVLAMGGADVRLKLNTSGDKPTTFSWSEYGYPLSDDGRIVGSATAVLKIKNAVVEDSGVYEVNAVNQSTGYTWNAGAQVTVLPALPIVGWGSDDFGSSPSTGPDLRDVVAISTGRSKSMSLDGSGNVHIWGAYDGYDQYVPYDELDDATMIGIGTDYAAALNRNGGLVIWNPDAMYSFGEVFSDVRSFCAGPNHLLAIKKDGSVVGWGTDDHGEIDPPAEARGAIAVAAGNGFSLALLRNGKIVGWGDNTKGQLMPPRFHDVIAIAAGDSHALAVRRNGSVIACGDNSAGQTSIPAGLTNVVAVAAGDMHSVALTADGRVITWGNIGWSSVKAPVGLRHVARIAAGGSHTLALIYAPLITLQPSVLYGDPQFSLIGVDAGGRFPLAFSWRLNGRIFKTTTDPYISVRTPANSKIAASQKYDVIVRNRYGAAVSQPITLPPLDDGSSGFSSGSGSTDSGGFGSIFTTFTSGWGSYPPPPMFRSAIASSNGIKISKQNDSIVLSWTTQGAVLECADSIEGKFTANVDGVQVTSGNTTSVTLPASSQQKFYRLRMP